MPMNSQTSSTSGLRRWATTAAAVCVVMLILSYVLGRSWVRTFARVDSVGTYLVVFYVLMAAFVATQGMRLMRWKPGIRFLGAAVGGHILAVAAVFVTALAEPSGFERLRNSLSQLDVIAIVQAYLLLTLPLGGWLVGVVAVVGTGILHRGRLWGDGGGEV